MNKSNNSNKENLNPEPFKKPKNQTKRGPNDSLDLQNDYKVKDILESPSKYNNIQTLSD